MNLPPSPVYSALSALSELVTTARWRQNVARYHEQWDVAGAYEQTALQLDAARTMLVIDGLDGLDEAWAFIDAGRVHLTELAIAEARR